MTGQTRQILEQQGEQSVLQWKEEQRERQMLMLRWREC